mmetsp:Transcript_12674/g.39134  ORF Transcript_12674/g.39134 Transcript_12674/m.39134 type:complete len:116 (-) Transcript_12674:4834-5181(-)
MRVGYDRAAMVASYTFSMRILRSINQISVRSKIFVGQQRLVCLDLVLRAHMSQQSEMAHYSQRAREQEAGTKGPSQAVDYLQLEIHMVGCVSLVFLREKTLLSWNGVVMPVPLFL